MGSNLLIDGLNLLPMLDVWPMLLAETTSMSQMLGMVYRGLLVALGLGFVIFVHELGHFLAAKTFGVRCDKFYVGFDVPISIGPIKLPRTLGKFQWGETEYGIGIVPLGGYVKMLGQDDDPRQAEIEAQKARLGGDEQAPLDPRSYPAKPVWQRMVIISAGVIMNLIFAVILAAVAYWFGVPYTPTVAGSAYGGSPAWIAGIDSGDQILKYGSMKEKDPYLPYNDFAMAVIMQGFDVGVKPMPLTLNRGGTEKEIVATPSAKYSTDRDVYRIGMNSPTSPTIGAPAFGPLTFLAEQKPNLKPGDVITAVGGETLPVDQRFGAVLGNELTSRLQAKWQEPIMVTVERAAKGPQEGVAPEKLELELPAAPVKTLGLGFAPGPITAIQAGSNAEQAGLKAGDILTEINGERIVDALRLPALTGQLVGQEVKLTIKRPVSTAAQNAEFESLELKLAGPERAMFDPISPAAGELTMGGMGIAFSVKPIITIVDDEHLETAGGLQAGDELLQIQWIASAARKKELSEYFSVKESFKQIVLDDTFNVASMYDMLQDLPVNSQIKCWVRRDGKTVEAIAKTEYAPNWYWHERGIGISPFMLNHQTDSVATALNLGVWETSRRFGDVLGFLRLLVTGKIGAKGVGGPIAIAEAASSEASFGISRLMIFLTLLSANLAILNFLPIPALDGGHMMFLTAEAIRGKPVNEALQTRLTMAGVLGLLSLMAFVIVKDLIRVMS